MKARHHTAWTVFEMFAEGHREQHAAPNFEGGHSLDMFCECCPNIWRDCTERVIHVEHKMMVEREKVPGCLPEDL